ncbi:hypothetical protein DICVIV_04133 [Dictyocaulus viviparus]|uniref:C3H1-type domain-containing protein n=1 Tax=Dictyocaulus viviparus TaxID=29172 RepID=A0A0D8Y0Q7_DICVI|nr:hypothetical protein DICVIV_04133 [Dictyocaulus viviparus]
MTYCVNFSHFRVRSTVNANLKPTGVSSTASSAAVLPTPSTCIIPTQQQKFPPFISLSGGGGGGGSITFDYEMPYGYDSNHPYNNHHNGRPATGKKTANPDSYKTVMCQAWLESKMCAFGENCRFAHGEAELRPVRSIPCQINKYKTKLCDKYTTTGLCPYGDRCLFIHPDHGTNAYIRPDKLVEVSRRHALADMQFLASVDPTRAVTPPTVAYLPGHPILTQRVPPPILQSHPQSDIKTAYNQGGVVFGSCGNTINLNGQARTQLRPHPSWPLEPSTFFKEKTDDFRTPSPVDGPSSGGKASWDQSSTPARSSSGYMSGGSTPSGTSPFSTVSSSSLHLNLTDDDRDFDVFNLTVGLDHIAQDLAKTLELW